MYLVVEDEPMFAELIALALGVEVVVAHSMSKAMALIDRNYVKCVVLDLSLPDSNPSQTMAKIREIKERSRGASVIVLTVSDWPEIKRRSCECGADGFVAKGTGSAFFNELTAKLKEPSSRPCAYRETVERIEQKVAAMTGVGRV